MTPDSEIVGGVVLRIPAIQSPNFVHGVSGWQVNANGSAEFHSLVIPPGSGGATIFVLGTTPTANAVGDLWYNSAAGFEASQWSGSAWVPFQYGTSAIASGAITAALIAANTITAAQIAAGTITAAQIAAGSVTTTLLAANAVTAAKIAAGTITAAQIAAGTITAANLIAGIVVAGIVDATTITAATFETSATAPRVVIDGPNNRIRFDGLGGGANAAVVETGGVNGDLDIFADILEIEGANVPCLVTLGGTLAIGTVGGNQATHSVDPAGYPTVQDQAGLTLNISGSKLANPASAGPYPINVPNATNASLGFMPVPAGDVETGATYQVRAAGLFSTGLTPPGSATFTIYWGGLAGNVLASIAIPGTILASAATLGWYVETEVIWASATEAVTALHVGWHTATGAGGSANYFTVGDVTGLVTSVNKNLSLGFQWGTAPSGTLLTCAAFRAGRVA